MQYNKHSQIGLLIPGGVTSKHDGTVVVVLRTISLNGIPIGSAVAEYPNDHSPSRTCKSNAGKNGCAREEGTMQVCAGSQENGTYLHSAGWIVWPVRHHSAPVLWCRYHISTVGCTLAGGSNRMRIALSGYLGKRERCCAEHSKEHHQDHSASGYTR